MTHDHTPPEDSGRNRFVFNVNGHEHNTSDPLPDGRDVLREAGFNPPSEHILIQLLSPGTRSIGLDEKIDLRAPGRERFRAFLSDRIFAFTVDEIGFEWGVAEISESELREFASVPPDKALVLEHKSAPPEIIAPGTKLNLAARGAEHIRTKHQLINVTYGKDEKEFKLEPGDYTGPQLSDIFHVPSGHVLDLVLPDGTFDDIDLGETVRIANGMHFVSHPPRGKSS